VIEVAIVRPGPIQGDMVHPYLRRRQGKEPVSYPSKELEAVLSKTMGVPLFQEQAMRIAIVAAGFTPSEADQLRRAMATFKKVGTIGTFQQKMIQGMKAKGYDPDFAERCFKQIEGFGEYGFPESHAASFALLVYSSCWLKCHYPDVFCAALLNSQPMGFYAPAQIVRDARQHGVEVRAVDVNHSSWDATLEPGRVAALHVHRDHREMEKSIRARHAVRLGLRQVKGLGEEDMAKLVAVRDGGFDSVRDLWLRTGLKRATIERLADADAFGSIGLSRRDALWAARGLDKEGRAEDLPLFAAADWRALQTEVSADLPPMPPGEEVIHDYRFLSLSIKAHPAQYVRAALAAEGVKPAEVLKVPAMKRRTVCVSGLVLVRQRPGSAKGVIFMTLEDETAVANIIVWPKVFEAHRQIVLGARFVKVTGTVQAEDGVVHLVAKSLEDRTPLLSQLATGEADWDVLDRADEVKRPAVDLRTVERPRSRLARLVQDAPELRGDLDAMLDGNRVIVDALKAHKAAAAVIEKVGNAGPGDTIPAPTATWGTARGAARDLSMLGSRRSARGASKALPKGRNFH
ncbi:MAG: OB-fold nucleic acid binding domain-containing protein, partial [Pseudomonadota bacterium]